MRGVYAAGTSGIIQEFVWIVRQTIDGRTDVLMPNGRVITILNGLWLRQALSDLELEPEVRAGARDDWAG